MIRTLLMALTALCLSHGAAAAPHVSTNAGALRGTETNGVEAFLGIPYAAPPTGPLRWREPQPVANWQDERDASAYGPACYQGVPAPWGPYSAEFLAGNPISEDCLFLNVWKPTGKRTKLPVLVFIHGGGFGGGAGSLPIYDGGELARRGAVVITINYRVGVFGFLAHPGLTVESPLHTSGNYGLLDQIAALTWVQANASRFGGDPGNVTVAGESAGAASVNDLMLTPLAKGLFHRAISLSGASMAIGVPSRDEGERIGIALGTDLGAHTVDALRGISADRLVEATSVSPSARSGTPRLVFVPHLDGRVVPSDPGGPVKTVLTRVPLMTGFNAAEMTDSSVDTPAQFEQIVRNRYGSFAERFLALYPHSDAAQVARSNILIARDRYMSGLLLWSRERAKTSGQAVYAYLYDHAYPPVPGGKTYGAFHSSELPYIFGTLGLGAREFAAQDRAIVRQWQDRILAFMRTGNPSLPRKPWRAVDAATTDVMGLGDTAAPRQAVSSKQRFEAFEAYAKSGGNVGLM